MAINPQIKNIIFRPPKAPNLPIAPVDYRQLYQDQVLNALRLYFNQIDSFAQGVLIPASGTTANRPTANLQVGQYYFDTTLGYPIYWDGAQWINALGYPLIFLTGVKTIGRVGTVTVTTV
jgi:hypothetical protein